MSPVIKYFNEERTESYLFIIIGVIALAITLYFFFGLKTPFLRGAAIPIALVAMLELVGGITISTRSSKDMARVENSVQNEPHNIKALELPRMKIVMRNFVIYRYVEIALIALSLILMFSAATNDFWKGVGIGLLIQTVLIICMDFFAERRGQVYTDYLINYIEKT